MRNYLLLILLVTNISAWSQKPQKTTVYKTIRTLYTDLNNDGKMDMIILSDNGLDGSFNRITIKLAGFQKQSFKAKQYWANFDSLFLKRNKNLVHSNLLFIKKTNKHTAILLWGGLDGAGYGIEFSIINIENNKVKMVFDPGNSKNDAIDVECPTSLVDLKGDGRLCFIFKGIGEFDKILKHGKTGSYTPYWVYPVYDSCKLNKPLTKAYNEKHYVFAGYDYSENISIYYPDNGGKPRIWKITHNKE